MSEMTSREPPLRERDDFAPRQRDVLAPRDRVSVASVIVAAIGISGLAGVAYAVSLARDTERAVFIAITFLAAILLLVRMVRRAVVGRDHARDLLTDCFNAADRGACVIDSHDRIITWNPAFLQMRDVPECAMRVGRPLAEVLEEANAVRPFAAFNSATFRRSALISRGADAVTSIIELEGGKILSKTIRPLPHDNAVVIYQDVTDSKQSELAFRDLATRLAATLDNVLDGIISIDSHGTIVSFSRGAEQMFGYRAEEVLGRNVSLLMPEVHARAHDSYLEAFRRTGKPRIMSTRRELEARRRDGTLFPIELGVSQMPLGGGRHFIGILRDISDRKRAERMQQDFISTVNHELRTPLTSIVGSLAVLGSGKTGPLTPRMWQLIELAQRNSDRLQALVNDILEIGQLDTGRLPLSLGRHAAMSVVGETVDFARAYAQLYDVQLNMSARGTVTDVNVDPARLQQIVTNLLSNAVKFSPRGADVDILIRNHRDGVLIEVADRGPGIPEEFRARIFGKFAQADTSDAKEKGGTGLGLYIARSLTERMGGAIDYDARAGGGTVFRLVLPAWREHSSVSEPTELRAAG
ncbi:MAG: PAS domain S-box protein [Steroidobacterales bacterium]